jgi:hypothetical protein
VRVQTSRMGAIRLPVSKNKFYYSLLDHRQGIVHGREFLQIWAKNASVTKNVR